MERRPSTRDRSSSDVGLVKQSKTATASKYDSSFHNGVSLRSASRSTKSTSDKLLSSPELGFRFDRQRTNSSPSNILIRNDSAKSRLLLDERTTASDGLQEDDGQLKSQSKKKKKKKGTVTANLSGTRYEIVHIVCERLGFNIVKDDDPNVYLIWNDSFISSERVSELKPYQHINHFPGMGEICRKDCLARNMMKMSKVHPEDYNFIPKTWILPAEYGTFQNYARELKKKKKNKVFIVKPANGAMGNGITLFKNAEKIAQSDHHIIQEYIEKPFLIDGYKCDLRIYVFVTSCDPLRIFLYNDGLLRMSTEKYAYPTDGNLDQLYMHLTNYSINKHSEKYEKSPTTDTGSKRSLKYLNNYLRHNDYDVARLWQNITDLIIKTLIVSHPHVLHAYRMCRPGQTPGSDSVCFEILGFDVILDRKLQPWLLEVNRSPSFGTDEKLDYEIKSGVIEDSLRLLNIRASDKRKNLAVQKAEVQRRLLRPAKRTDGDTPEIEKKRQLVEKKKEELKEMLIRLRREAVREEFENRHCGRFKRIFPPQDKFRQERYTKLLSDAYGVFLSGRASSLQQEIKKTYCNMLREEDVLDMLAQCEADEKEGRLTTSNRPRGLKPLQGMPPLIPEPRRFDEDLKDEEEEDEEEEEEEEAEVRSKSPSRFGMLHSPSVKTQARQRPRGRPISVNKVIEPMESSLIGKQYEDEITNRTLMALNEMRIKFPGKTDEEADFLLDKLHENWKFHKPRIANYWLVKLDSIKRRKVIDIVRTNVHAVLQRIWKTTYVEGLRLYRIVNRVFNRLLWSHGQGLWGCFQDHGNSWETIFNKSSEVITEAELACCRRVVQLCCDCLLIVYQFAADAKNAVTHTADQPAGTSKVTKAN